MSHAVRMSEADYEAHQARRRPPSLAELATGTFARVPMVPIGAKPQRERSQLEIMFLAAHAVSGLPPMTEEYKPLPPRRFRIDFSYPQLMIGVECDGAVHRTKDRFKADIERASLLTVAGWKMLRVGRSEIQSGKAIEWLRLLLEGNQK